MACVAAVALGSAAADARRGSPYPWRGVIQAQYGSQFSARERVRLLRFMGRNGFNAYVHAPKDDPYQRILWRDPYPTDRQRRLDADVALAGRLGIEWIPNVSPGIPGFASPGEGPPPGTTPSPPLCFSCPAEVDALLAKFEPFRQAGADTFMVSFDDVRSEFAHPVDALVYGEGDRAYGAANGDLLSRLYAGLRQRDPAARLLTVGADYSGTVDTEYLRGLRGALAPGIEVMWTGPGVEARRFAPADADNYGLRVGRAPIVWENWTTTDLIRDPGMPPTRVFLGPYARGRGLAEHVRGFFFNPANEAELNFLPLATAADWLRHPRAYRPRRAFLREVRGLAGRQSAFLRAFAETSYSSTLRTSVEAPTFAGLAHRFLRVRRGRGNGLRQAARLRRELALVMRARARLRRVKALRPFLREARPFLRSARLEARSALVATKLLQARDAGRRQLLRHRLRRLMRRSAGHPQETFGSRSGVFGLTGNRVDSYVKRARRLDRAR
ncbi:MAG: beta-N-acetylglucosaminidase domain-containing protein [Actinomycetota bacterium]